MNLKCPAQGPRARNRPAYSPHYNGRGGAKSSFYVAKSRRPSDPEAPAQNWYLIENWAKSRSDNTL